MAVNTSSNSELTQDEVARILLTPLAERSTWLGLGTPLFTSAGQPIHLPKLTSIGTAISHVAEGGTIAAGTATTDEVVLLPSTVYAIKTILPITNEARAQSVVNAEAAFTAALTTRVADILDASMWNGSGTGGAPKGLFGMTGFTNAGTVTAGSLTADHLYAMDEAYTLQFGGEASAMWAMHPTRFTEIRKLENDIGMKLLQPSLSGGAPSTLLGKPYTVTTYAPGTAIALFDRNQVATGQGPSSVTILSEFYADTDSIGVRVVSRWDVQPLNAATIVKKFVT